MAISDPVKVKGAAIVTPVQVTSFASGLDERGEYNIPPDAMSYGRNAMVNSANNATKRLSKQRWLPDSVGFNSEVSTVYYGGEIYYFIADGGKVKYIQDNGTAWIDCGTADTAATLTTALTGTNNDLVFTAVQAGASQGERGNNVTVAYIDPAGNNQPLGVVVTDTDIVVNLATNGGGTITSTANSILAAIQASDDASELVTVALAGGNDGTGVVTAMAEDNLAGGIGTNQITTTSGVITTFLRVNDILFCMNGVDELRFIRLSDLEMVVFTHVDDPTDNITAVATGITGSGPFNVYYAYTYNSDGGGETAISSILTQAVSKSRSTWAADGTEYLTLTFNDTPPADATSRNLYAAIALQGTTPVASDLAMLKSNIATSEASFVDNGSIPFDLSYNTAPDTNSTDGIKAAAGTMAGSIPVLYGDPDNPYDLYFGGLTDDGVSFGANNGAQRLPLLKGTNYYPTSVIGFRNNQNIPNLLTLFSGTEGVSKQQIISMKTLSYGNTTINYWGADDLNAGASAVYARYGVVSYLGQLLFPSSQGITSIKTDANLQNVLSPSIVSNQIAETYSTIKNAAFNKVVGAPWNNLVAFTVPSRGYDYNNQMIVYDLTNKEKPKWYIWDIEVDWVGAVSPPDSDSFLYIRQDNHFFKLVESYAAKDEESNGTYTSYPVTIETALLSPSPARNSFFAATQAVVYVANFVGTVNVEVSYVDKKGRIKTKEKSFTNTVNSNTRFNGWGNPRLLWRSFNNRMINWSTPMPFSGEFNDSGKINKRLRIRLPNTVVNEAKFKVWSELDNTSFDVVGCAIEAVNIGVIGDIV